MDRLTILPDELKLKISKYLPKLSSHLLAESLWWKLTPEQKHSRAWASIFKNDEWLSYVVSKGCNPVLIGHDLYKDGGFKYLVLVIGHDGNHGSEYGGFGRANYHTTNENLKLFRSSLQENFPAYISTRTRGIDYDNYHEIIIPTEGLWFPKEGIKLSINDIQSNGPTNVVSAPWALVSKDKKKPTSAYLYWKDASYTVRKIETEHVKGEGPVGRTFSRLVQLKWEHQPSNKLRRHTFALQGGGVTEYETGRLVFRSFRMN